MKNKIITTKKRLGKFSGIITIRTTSTVHGGLKSIAKKENVSLNHLVSNYLSQRVYHETGIGKRKSI